MHEWTQLDEAKYQDRLRWFGVYEEALKETNSPHEAEARTNTVLSITGRVVFPDGSRMTGDKVHD